MKPCFGPSNHGGDRLKPGPVTSIWVQATRTLEKSRITSIIRGQPRSWIALDLGYRVRTRIVDCLRR